MRQSRSNLTDSNLNVVTTIGSGDLSERGAVTHWQVVTGIAFRNLIRLTHSGTISSSNAEQIFREISAPQD